MEEQVQVQEIQEQEVQEAVYMTQSEVDKAISKRLEKERTKEAKVWQEKYSEYLSPEDVKNRTEELNNQIASLGNSLDEAKKASDEDKQTIEDLKNKLHNSSRAR